MVFSTHRVLILLICIGLLSVQPDKVSGLRNIDTALGEHKENNQILLQIRRFLKVVNMDGMNTKKRSSSQNDKFDPDRSSKRKVGRGSDPIHNRS
ncbi:hypothetical protein L484_001442 [Morus notabilis]|uniref:CLAVATA3/ESR (CLE)-related protein 45 n=1 Tax=Morus notabilis TaxID=981085 RepID=W9QB86_9ROSA|nr:CLAVATA3/ESR (CLE)-related protein 45 [Morus notabilis]EXB20249.1 hypothetical protein L484_001442 [Morus notabilis]